MVLTTQYLRYVPGSVFGLVGSGQCVKFVTRFSQVAKYVAVPACENVLIWDSKRSSKVLTLNAEVKGQVTVIEPRPPAEGSMDNTHIAVGYTDGTVVIFDLQLGQPLKFTGHRGAVSSITWDRQGMRVASGSDDGEIVIWDVVSERGMVRLRGHKGRITRLRFLKQRNVVASSCKDSYIKFWDLDTNHCFRTLTGHRAESWPWSQLRHDLRIYKSLTEIERFSGASNYKDATFSVFNKIKKEELESEEPFSKFIRIDTEGSHKTPVVEDEKIEDDASILEIKRLGSILRSRSDRVCGIETDGRVVVCHGKSPVVDLFVLLSEEEIETKVARRKKKARKRAREAGIEEEEVEEEIQLSDEIRNIPSIRAQAKLAGIDAHSDRAGNIKLLTLLVNNSMAIYGTTIDAKEEKSQDFEKKKGLHNQLNKIDLPGHRNEVRAVAFNSLGDQVISASGDSVKVWHRSDSQCVSTMACDYALSLLIVPGDRHALIGTRSGLLQLFDISSGAILEDIMAHEPDETSTDTGVWSVALTHDGRGFVSGGSDKMVKFWKFELVSIIFSSSNFGLKLFFMLQHNIFKLSNEVTCICCSSNGKFVAVATLDNKETLYFSDTLKLCHELYGKSMPSTCMDFSQDGDIIATGSKDSSIRIFGTDFGDQRRLLKNAHQGGVTALNFISKTHMFFSCGHDGTVKQWDADNFQRIVTLNGHSGIVSCQDSNTKGGSKLKPEQYRPGQFWQLQEEPMMRIKPRKEKREEERREEDETEGGAGTQAPVVEGEQASAQAVRPTNTTYHTERAADMILEALSIYREQVEAGATATPHQLMQYVYNTNDPLKFVLEVLRKVKSSEIEEAILVLPLDRILELLVVLKGVLERGWDTELASRVLIAALRVNLSQLLAAPRAAPVIHALAHLMPKCTQEIQDMVGFNLAGLRHLKDRVELRTETQLFAEATQRTKENRKKRKKKERAIKRALLTI
ncbi:unnamed protein product, partial [Meganyctiphanes norvegica]